MYIFSIQSSQPCETDGIIMLILQLKLGSTEWASNLTLIKFNKYLSQGYVASKWQSLDTTDSDSKLTLFLIVGIQSSIG